MVRLDGWPATIAELADGPPLTPTFEWGEREKGSFCYLHNFSKNNKNNKILLSTSFFKK
jgi:hypothetical protein